MIFNNTSTMTKIESWFIPFDILMIVCTVLAIILAVLGLYIIIIDKTCHTIPLMLVANSCFAELIWGFTMLSLVIFILGNDLKQIEYEYSLCIFLGYMCYAGCAAQMYSYFLQSIYRYITVVYPTRLFWQTVRTQFSLIVLSWILSLIHAIPMVFTNQIIYNVENQICQIPLGLSFLIIFDAFYVYLFPLGSIIFVYFKLVRYVQEMSKRVTPVNILLRAQRELKMLRRIVILVIILLTLGFPYAIFIFVSFFTTAVKYHFRIAYLCVDVSLAFVMIALLQFTDPLKTYIMKKMNGRPTVVVPTILHTNQP